MEKLFSRIGQESTSMILECLMQIGGSINVSREERMVRAALIEVYERRTSPEDADVLMDAMGM